MPGVTPPAEPASTDLGSPDVPPDAPVDDAVLLRRCEIELDALVACCERTRAAVDALCARVGERAAARLLGIDRGTARRWRRIVPATALRRRQPPPDVTDG